MGNRAIITSKKDWEKHLNCHTVKARQELANDGMGIYLHWNGGLESVKAFLDYAHAKGYGNPNNDSDYGWARLCQIIANFFSHQSSLPSGLNPDGYPDSGLSVGVGNISRLAEPADNGVYVFDDEWQIVDRADTYDDATELIRATTGDYNYELYRGMLDAIDQAQPVKLTAEQRKLLRA